MCLRYAPNPCSKFFANCNIHYQIWWSFNSTPPKNGWPWKWDNNRYTEKYHGKGPVTCSNSFSSPTNWRTSPENIPQTQIFRRRFGPLLQDQSLGALRACPVAGDRSVTAAERRRGSSRIADWCALAVAPLDPLAASIFPSTKLRMIEDEKWDDLWVSHMLHGADIFTYIWVIFRVNVGIHIPYMEHLGFIFPEFIISSIVFHQSIFGHLLCLRNVLKWDLNVEFDRSTQDVPYLTYTFVTVVAHCRLNNLLAKSVRTGVLGVADSPSGSNDFPGLGQGQSPWYHARCGQLRAWLLGSIGTS